MSLAVTAAMIPALFWLRFGTVDGFAVGLTAFLLLVQIAIDVIPRKAEELGATRVPAKFAPSRFDFLGVVWVLCFPFAPFLSWVLTNALDVDRANWRTLLGIRALLCVVLPLITVLPLVRGVRYTRRGAVGIMITVLVVGTGFPVATGIGSAYDVVSGPAWQDVTVAHLSDVAFRLGGRRVRAPDAVVKLSDGRSLSRSEKVTLHEGPMRLLVLRGFGRIIDTAP